MRARDEDGFSMVELLMGLAILGMVTAAIYGCFFSGVQGWQKGVERMDHQQNGRIAVDRIVRELRYASYVEPLSGGEELRFEFTGDDKIYYFKRVGPAADDLVLIHRHPDNTVTQTKIALKITALSFFVDEHNNVQINLASGTGPDRITIRSSFRPRNIP
ncbi:MAG: prepilin-type N-terminal cleavage/methylation domain-containing protein [Firmicutes bacterium]|nr:prepilin-type N-terminal cleavage/methylation domain-containing protein [Bacillota bacterium]